MNEAESNKKYEYWVWPKVINKDQIKEINSICEKHYIPNCYDNPAENTVKTANVKAVAWKYLKPVLSNIMEIWIERNREIFGYSLFPIQNKQFLNINTYDFSNQEEYDWHLDVTRDHVTDIKLTGIINISDESYEGGEFSIFLNGFTNIPEIREPGTILLLGHKVLHKVSPVTKGKRKTISYWFRGPKFI